MSLRSFHILFIALSSLLAFAFGAWALDRASYRSLGLAALVAGCGLVAYGVWFLRRLRTPLVVLPLLWFFSTRDALACPVCYGDAGGPLIDAARMGVWLLFGLVLCLQLLFGSFFVVLWRRARKHRQDETALS